VDREIHVFFGTIIIAKAATKEKQHVETSTQCEVCGPTGKTFSTQLLDIPLSIIVFTLLH
jgi:hypothetical protein